MAEQKEIDINSSSGEGDVGGSAVDEYINYNSDEKIINWEEEAAAIINDVKKHVAEIEISRQLPSSPANIYLNIRTIEEERFCVHVSSNGFRVVSHRFDTVDSNKVDPIEEEVYETPYALLDKISPRYVESFGNQLCKQLLNLQQMRTQFNEEDEEEMDEEHVEGKVKVAKEI